MQSNKTVDEAVRMFGLVLGRGFRRVRSEDIQQATGLSKQKVRRMLSSFEVMNLLDRDEYGYRISNSLLSLVSSYGADLAASVAEQMEQQAMVQRAQMALNRLTSLQPEGKANG